MALVVISIDRDKLPSHTNEQFEEWVMFYVNQRGGISNQNPLADVDLEAMVREISK
ncbi:hypothetical protein ACW5WQ_20350 [Aeromonas rivuli]|uniref:hypothetical protein n=1 Tax=Aeromonas rivuli TaxID=648794 RepID=UPI0012EE3877|nr:hypothetical protein [Aeromonas rivuli]